MQTECTPQQLEFEALGRRRVVGAFDGGRMTSDGGALLLREADRLFDVTGRLAACFADYRDQRRCEHSVALLVAQRVMALALGYEDLNDHDRLLVDLFLKAHEQAPEEIVLDMDATDDPVHGRQEGRFFHGYYRCHCYLPLYVTCGEHVLCSRLRTADRDASYGALDELGRIIPQIRTAWPQTRIIIRADSGFCRDEIMAWCEAEGVGYVFGLARNSRLRQRIGKALHKSRRRCVATGRPSRRVVAKAEWLVNASSKLTRNTRPKLTHLQVLCTWDGRGGCAGRMNCVV